MYTKIKNILVFFIIGYLSLTFVIIIDLPSNFIRYNYILDLGEFRAQTMFYTNFSITI